jgi:hypothetical protein
VDECKPLHDGNAGWGYYKKIIALKKLMRLGKKFQPKKKEQQEQ